MTRVVHISSGLVSMSSNLRHLLTELAPKNAFLTKNPILQFPTCPDPQGVKRHFEPELNWIATKSYFAKTLHSSLISSINTSSPSLLSSSAYFLRSSSVNYYWIANLCNLPLENKSFIISLASAKNWGLSSTGIVLSIVPSSKARGGSGGIYVLLPFVLTQLVSHK